MLLSTYTGKLTIGIRNVTFNFNKNFLLVMVPKFTTLFLKNDKQGSFAEIFFPRDGEQSVKLIPVI
jgi:hypothetical protein